MSFVRNLCIRVPTVFRAKHTLRKIPPTFPTKPHPKFATTAFNRKFSLSGLNLPNSLRCS